MNSELRPEVRFLTRIFGPLVSPKGASIILVANIAFALCLTWAQLSVTARLQRNSTIATLLALEIKRESSTDLGQARKTHASLIRSTMVRMQDPAMRLLGILRPKSSPEV